MLKAMPNYQYNERCERMLKEYEKAGFTPLECMSDMTDLKARYASSDGYADGCLLGGVSLLLAGLICKWLARKDLQRMSNAVNAKLQYAASIKPLTDFKVPTGDEENREENND